jgi:hypothetical protein
MLIEAELDDTHSERLLTLQERLQKPLAEVVAELLAHAIDSKIETVEADGQKMLRIFAEEGLIGCIQEDSKLSIDYKQHLWSDH